MQERNKELLVSFDNVGLRYPRASSETLRNIDLQIHPGDFYFLTGKSGAGKSSLLKLIDLSLRPSRGVIELFGHRVSSLPSSKISQVRRKIGVVFQDYKLISNLTVADNIALPLKIIKKPLREVRRALAEMLDYFHLTELKHKFPLSLSGGQQQLVALARAFITAPDIILADEPTASIDEDMSDRIMTLLLELKKQGTAVILATHNNTFIKRYRQNVLTLRHGLLSAAGYKEWDKSSIYA